MGTEFTYEVLYAKKEIGPWIKDHAIRLTDESIDTLRGGVYYSTNIYTIDDLDPDVQYYIRVGCIDKHHQWWYNYSGEGSVEQVQGFLEAGTAPTGDNSIGFQLNITANDAWGFGHGAFGNTPFG